MTGSPGLPTGLLRTPEIAGAGSIRRALGALETDGSSLGLVGHTGTFPRIVSPTPADLVASRVGEQALSAVLTGIALRAPDAPAPHHPTQRFSGRRPTGDRRREPPVPDTPPARAASTRPPDPTPSPSDTLGPLSAPAGAPGTAGVTSSNPTPAWSNAPVGRVVVEIPNPSSLRLAAMAGLAPGSRDDAIALRRDGADARRDAAAPRSANASSDRADPVPLETVESGPSRPSVGTDAAGEHVIPPAERAPSLAPVHAPARNQNGLVGLVHLWQTSAEAGAAPPRGRIQERPVGGRAALRPPGVPKTSTHSRSASIGNADRDVDVDTFTEPATTDAVPDLEAEARLLELLERALRGEARRLGVDLDHEGLL